MNKLKFSLLTAAILLAGALAAGAAAGGVVRPPVGEVQSAGVLPIPTVLGQTAEEVLFYPWALYDTQKLYHIPEDMLLEGLTEEAEKMGVAPEEVRAWLSGEEVPFSPPTGSVFALPLTFSAIWPVELPWYEALTSLECNWDVREEMAERTQFFLQFFLKELPATAYLDGTETPVTLSLAFAEDREALSYLIRPGQPRAVTEAERTAALEQVDQDLRQMFLYPDPGSSELIRMFEMFFIENEYILDFDEYGYFLDSLFPWWAGYPMDAVASKGWEMGETGWRWYDEFRKDLEGTSLDEFLAMVETMGPFTVQVVDAQQQIVVLFTLEEGHVFGVYYDVQLGCWSGVGVMS